jgi:hypothetical protein
MEELRMIKRPRNGRVTINLPVEFPSQEKVEIIILPYREKKETQKKFDPREFFGAAHLNMTEDEIDQKCKKLRDEWERNF